MTGVPMRAALLVMLLGLGLAACAPPSREGARSAPTSPTPPDSTASTSAAPKDDRKGTPIRIHVGDQNLDATLWDTPAGQGLLHRLQLTLRFSDFNGVEKVSRLADPLPMDGMPKGDDPQVGDLGWYAPAGTLVLYYGDVGYWDGIARLGRVHGDLTVISTRTGDFDVTLEAAE